MARNITIDGTVYPYPTQGESPTHGDVQVDTIEALATKLASIETTGDISSTEFTIANNQSSADVTNLVFDPVTIRSAEVFYSIYRESDSTTSGKAESGIMLVVYDDNASSTNKWLLTQYSNGDSGVEFDVDDDGQFTYVSSDIGSAGYSGTMVFRAKVTSV